MRGHNRAARYAAPAAFLAAATVAIVLVRSGLDNGEATTPPAATTATTAPETTSDGTTQTGTPASAEFYVIRSGDTLADVAAQHGTSVEALLSLNPDVDPVALTIGDRIRVK